MSEPFVEVPQHLIDPSGLIATVDDPTPHVDFIFRQIDALQDAMVRRDSRALALGRALDGPTHAPTVQMQAAGVRWLSGDPDGVDAIIAALGRVPRAASVLVPLIPALRAAGEFEGVAAIERAAQEVVAALAMPLKLDRMWGRATKLTPLDVPPVVAKAIAEIAMSVPWVKTVWLTEARAGAGVVLPAVVVVRQPNLSGWRLGGGSGERVAAAIQAIRAIWPVTEWAGYDSLEGRGQQALRNTLPALRSRPRRSRRKR